MGLVQFSGLQEFFFGLVWPETDGVMPVFVNFHCDFMHVETLGRARDPGAH